MRQEQIQRKRHARNGPDNESDEIPTEVSEHAAKVSSDATDLINRINQETE